MLCASGFEFEEKLHLAKQEHENARRALQPVSSSSESSSKRFEDAVKRYNRRLSDFVNHKRVARYAEDPKRSVIADSLRKPAAHIFCFESLHPVRSS